MIHEFFDTEEQRHCLKAVPSKPPAIVFRRGTMSHRFDRSNQGGEKGV